MQNGTRNNISTNTSNRSSVFLMQKSESSLPNTKSTFYQNSGSFVRVVVSENVNDIIMYDAKDDTKDVKVIYLLLNKKYNGIIIGHVRNDDLFV